MKREFFDNEARIFKFDNVKRIGFAAPACRSRRSRLDDERVTSRAEFVARRRVSDM